MNLTMADMVHIDSTNQHDLKHGPDLVRVSRGWALRLRPGDREGRPWEIRSTVAEARILALRQLTNRPVVFARSSALVLWGIPSWTNNPDVTFRSVSHYNARQLDPVTIGGITVPAVRAHRVDSEQVVDDSAVLSGIPVDGLHSTAVLLARSAHPLEAFVAVSAILRRLAGDDVWALRRHRESAEGIRRELMSAVTHRLGLRGSRAASRLIEHADASCESVGERALLWVVLAISPEIPHTQVEVTIESATYFLDIALLGLMIAFEFDGAGKMGENGREFHAAKRQMMDRDLALQRAGWTVFHFSWSDLADLGALRQRLIRMCRWESSAADPVRSALWIPVPAELTNRDRRF